MSKVWDIIQDHHTLSDTLGEENNRNRSSETFKLLNKTE